MFDVVPYSLLVRRVRSGDCDKIGELYEVVEPELIAFCQSLTNDAAAARRSAEGAFAHAAGLLVTQSVTVAGFRSALLGEAKGRCYEELGRAAMSEFRATRAETSEPMDLALLQQHLEEKRPESLRTPAARLTWRSRLAPSTAITVVLVMVVMIEMAALGLDLMPKSPPSGESGSTPAKTASRAESPQQSKAIVSDVSSNRDRDSKHTADSEAKKSPSRDQNGGSNSTVEQPSSDSAKREQASSPADDSPLKQLPVADDLPELPVPEVQVDVEVGPVDVAVDPPKDSGLLPSTSACVGSSCVTLP